MQWPGYPFYPHVRGIGIGRVYHSHPACQVARSIEPRYRIPGNAEARPECPLCRVHHEATAANRSPTPPAG